MKHWARVTLEELLWLNAEATTRLKGDATRIAQLLERRAEHEFRTEALEVIADQLSVCGALSDLSKCMWSMTTSLGFENFAIFVVKEAAGASFAPKICTSYNQQWIEQYVSKGYQYIDPVMTKVSESDGFFLFSELQSGAPIVREFWADAAKYRIGQQGLCFALTRTDGSRVGVSFSTQKTSEQLSELVDLNLYDMNFLAVLAADAFCYLSCSPAPADDVLSLAELKFLQVLSTSSNPSEALDVSSSFGSNKALQASIRAKLGVETVFQALVMAASRGWLTSLPYDTKDISRTFPPLSGLESIDTEATKRD